MDSKQDLLIASGPNYGPSQTAGGVSDRPKVDHMGLHSYNRKFLPNIELCIKGVNSAIQNGARPLGDFCPGLGGSNDIGLASCPLSCQACVAELRPLLPKAPPSWERPAGEKVK